MSRTIDVLPALARMGGPATAASRALIAAIAGRTAARMARLQRTFTRPTVRAAIPDGAALLAATRRAVRSLPRRDREHLLHGPDLRGFLAAGELWVDALRLAGRLAADPADRRSRNRLFARLAATEHLVTLLPHGRIDRRCAERTSRFARGRLRTLIPDLAACLAGIRLLRPDGTRIELRLAFCVEPEVGRPGDRLDLGTVHTPAGPLSLRRPARRKNAPGAGVRVRIAGRTLLLTAPRSLAVALPAAASPLRFPAGAPFGQADAARSDGMRLVRRPIVPGTSIILAPALHSSPGRLSVGRGVRGLGARLSRALRALGILWPEMRAEVERRTAMVVPVREPGLVSYSLAARPGVSFINVGGKRIVDLADDLLHETAHHLLHDVQELVPLLVPGQETEDVQAFDSPWRGTRRPLHGVLHGCYTFLFRAELLIRLRDARGAPSRLIASLLGKGSAEFARREARRELKMLGEGLRQLGTAARAGLLTDDGRRLARAMRVWYAGLVASETATPRPWRNR